MVHDIGYLQSRHLEVGVERRHRLKMTGVAGNRVNLPNVKNDGDTLMRYWSESEMPLILLLNYPYCWLNNVRGAHVLEIIAAYCTEQRSHEDSTKQMYKRETCR